MRTKGIVGMLFEYFNMRIQGDWPIYFQVDGGILIIGSNRVMKVAKQGDNLVGHLNTSDAKIQDY